jgi:hypothetical protein
MICLVPLKMTQPGPENANDVHHERAFDGVRGGMARM